MARKRAKAVITITDKGKHGVDITTHFDPPIASEFPAPRAAGVALDMLNLWHDAQAARKAGK